MSSKGSVTKTYSYEQAVSYLDSVPRFVDKRFEGAKAFYEYLKDKGVITEGGRKVFHVAGTNGKGSVCAFLKSMHMAMGKRVGVFTSPHLIDLRERITIGDVMITKEDLADAFMTVMSYLEEFGSSTPYSDYVPVYFDWLFFIAAVYFEREKTDAIIWETGLGGRYDATNVIGYKSVTVITEIGMDHMEILGDSIDKIASEKAGIIRRGTPVITVDRDPLALDVISSVAKSMGSPLTVVPNASGITKKMNDKGIDFSYKSHYYNNATLEVVGHAVYQTENATLAVTAMEAAYSADELPFECVYEGIKNMHHPGRMEEVAPGVFFDGAHNTDGIGALLESVRHDGCRGLRYMIFSAVGDKQADIELAMVAESGLFDKVCLVPISGARGRSHDELSKLLTVLTDRQINGELAGDLRTAYDSYRQGLREEDRLYVCGSLYLIGELKEMIM